jgi:hypothetical protein
MTVDPAVIDCGGIADSPPKGGGTSRDPIDFALAEEFCDVPF